MVSSSLIEKYFKVFDPFANDYQYTVYNNALEEWICIPETVSIPAVIALGYFLIVLMILNVKELKDSE